METFLKSWEIGKEEYGDEILPLFGDDEQDYISAISDDSGMTELSNFEQDYASAILDDSGIESTLLRLMRDCLLACRSRLGGHWFK